MEPFYDSSIQDTGSGGRGKETSEAFWSFSGQEVLAPLETTPQGLSWGEARQRLEQDGANRLKPPAGPAPFPFAILLIVSHATSDQFRSGWFLESVISAALIVLAVQTRRPFLESPPGKSLLLAILLIAAATALFPYTPLAGPFGFRPLPLFFFSAMGMIGILCMIAAEMAKRYFYRKVEV
jgi:hypothetical protein